MDQMTIRAPRIDDWPAILDLAHLSLSEMPNAPSQQEWLDNRRSFSDSDGIQTHFVAFSSEQITGYACVERRNNAANGVYRLFVVVAPSARATLGTHLLARLRECLIDLGACRASMVEYEADAGFISYLEAMGFARDARFKLEDGSQVVRLTMEAPFQSLVSRI
jgi:acetyltransferase (GNAT) family protein